MLFKTRLGLVPLAFGISKGTCCISILLLLIIQRTELFSILPTWCCQAAGAERALECGRETLQQRFRLSAPRSQMPWGPSFCRGDPSLRLSSIRVMGDTGQNRRAKSK